MQTFIHTNKRGLNYVMVPETEWKNSAYSPRACIIPLDSLPTTDPGWMANYGSFGSSYSFLDTMQGGYNNNPLNSTAVSAFTFNGGTKTAMWYYFNENDVDSQLSYLRDSGVNSIRVFLDIFCWAGFKDTFLSRLKTFANICDKYKLRVEYTTFDGITISDDINIDIFPVINPLMNYYTPQKPKFFEIDKFKLNDCIIWGLLTWRSSPAKESLLQFHPSSIQVSGNQYLKDVYSVVSSNQSTYNFDICNEFPSGEDAFNFVVSATTDLRNILDSTGNKHKLTLGFAAINALSGPAPLGYKFKEELEKIVPKLDFISVHPYSTLGYMHKYIEHIQTLAELSISSSKPIVGNEGVYPPLFMSLGGEVSSYTKLNFGYTFWDAMVDRPLGGEPFLKDNGLFFSDGQVRSLLELQTLRQSALDHGFLKKKQLNYKVKEKSKSTTSYKDGGYSREFAISSIRLDANSIDNEVIYKHPLGIIAHTNLTNTILDSKVYLNPLSCSASTSFTPYRGDDYSMVGQYSLAYKVKHFDQYLSELLTWSSLPPLSSITDVVTKNLALFERLEILNILYLGIAPNGGYLSQYGRAEYNTKYDFKLVSDSNLLAASSMYDLFNNSQTGISPSMNIEFKFINPLSNLFICSANIQSKGYSVPQTVDTYPNGITKVTHNIVSGYDKPKCYYNTAAGASGSCYYKQGESVGTNKFVYQNVYSKLDWAKYDQKLTDYANSLITCYNEINSRLLAGAVPNLLVGRVPQSHIDSITPKSFFPLKF